MTVGEVVHEPDYDAEMRLPEGVTCDGCAHAKRCFGMGFSTPGRTSCDFWPSRFRAELEGLLKIGKLAAAPSPLP